MRSGVPAGDGDLDGHRDGAGHDAPVKGAEEAEGVVVGVDQGHAVTGLDTAKGVSLETDSVLAAGIHGSVTHFQFFLANAPRHELASMFSTSTFF